jgi:very-short-patch-repair endonuclease
MNPISHRTNLKDQKTLRQSLRNNATATEAILWRALKGKQVDGLKFRRQFGLGPYVLDFYCPEIRLCIELDGEVHKSYEQSQYDEIRTRFMASNNIKVIRFENDVV